MKLYKYTYTYTLDQYEGSPKYIFEHIGIDGGQAISDIVKLTRGKAWIWPNTTIEEIPNK